MKQVKLITVGIVVSAMSFSIASSAFAQAADSQFVTTYDQDLASVQNQLAQVKQEIANLNEETANNNIEIQNNMNQIANDTAELNQYSNPAVVQSQLASAQTALTNATQLRDQMAAQIASEQQPLNQQIDQYDSQIADIDQRVQEARQRIEHNRGDLFRIQQQLNQIGSPAQISARINAAQIGVQSASAQLANVRQQNGVRAQSLQNQINALANSQRVNSGRIIGLRRQIVADVYTRNQLQIAIARQPNPTIRSQLQVQLNRTQAQIIQDQRAIQSLIQSNRQSGAQIQGLRAQLNQLNAGIQAAQARLSEAQQQLAAAQSQMNQYQDMQNTIPVLVQNNRRLHRRIEEMSMERENLVSQRLTLVSQVQSLQNQLIPYNNQVQQAQAQVNQLNQLLQNIGNLQQQIASLQQQDTQLQQTNNANTASAAGLQKSIPVLTAQISGLSAEVAYAGVVLSNVQLSRVDTKKATDLNLKVLNFANVDANEILKRTDKVVDVVADTQLSLTEQTLLVDYLRMGGLLVVWGAPETLLPASANGPTSSTLRDLLNAQTKESTVMFGLVGVNDLNGLKLNGVSSNGLLSDISLEPINASSATQPILHDGADPLSYAGIESLTDTGDSTRPGRALTLGLSFDQVNSAETQEIVRGLCASIRAQNQPEASFRMACAQ